MIGILRNCSDSYLKGVRTGCGCRKTTEEGTLVVSVETRGLGSWW